MPRRDQPFRKRPKIISIRSNSCARTVHDCASSSDVKASICQTFVNRRHPFAPAGDKKKLAERYQEALDKLFKMDKESEQIHSALKSVFDETGSSWEKELRRQ